ncbi:NUDIX hydrolase domain-like protein [Amanita muscaria]
MASVARRIASTELSASEARRVKFYLQEPSIILPFQEGKERVWEYAERKTRKSSVVDAVAIFAILRSKTNAFPPSTVIVEQYRPPIDRVVIELPAGLVDEHETPEDAAKRELTEETGYVGTKIIETSPIIVCDPGMTNANMKLITIEVLMEHELTTPDQHLDTGEHIVRRVVDLEYLESVLKEYDNKGYVVDARLFHLAAGYAMATRLK